MEGIQMNRRRFFTLATGAVLGVGGAYFLLSDKSNFTRADSNPNGVGSILLKADEREILFLASLAPSGHNSQPLFIKYIEPYHWIICNDKSRWLPAVDPTQRETMLSVGAFMQNLDYAANHFGYEIQATVLAKTNQDEQLIEVILKNTGKAPTYNIDQIIKRRTVRSNYLSDALNKDDAADLIKDESNVITYVPNTAKEYGYLNEQTIEANRIQSYRDAAQTELSEWIRFSSQDAAAHRDGLTMASMEIEGVAGWALRNYYDKSDVMKSDFREKNVETVKLQVSQSAGWLIITSKGNRVEALLEAGKCYQRLGLKVRERNIAIHPMSQILEEAAANKLIKDLIGTGDNIQFLLRVGYLKNYPDPVSLRRNVENFVRF
jgi:hypothetical protein